VTEAAILLAVATLGAGLVVAFAIRLLPRIRLQLAGLALLAVVLPLVAVLASGWVMFHMEDDANILSVAAASALSAVVAALLLARWIIGPLDRLRDASAELAAGDLSARAPTSGPSEIAELGGSFNEMADSIEQLFDARRQLVAWASHDLRTPLASMTAMIEAIEDDLAAPEEYLPALHDQVRQLSRLVDDLFELARIDAGDLTVELAETSLDGIVTTCLQGLAAEARARQIDLRADLDRALPRVRCAPDKVERVLFNLLTNALRHTPSDGSIAVHAHPERESVVVAVEDTGDGLTPEAVARMFDRFWRGEPSRSSHGSGLGLAIARGLVEAQGGRIWAENRPQGGARIAFTLPAAPA
jgi:signal transduction histidine kinase